MCKWINVVVHSTMIEAQVHGMLHGEGQQRPDTAWKGDSTSPVHVVWWCR